jgi:hypothetical protein
LRQLLQKPLPHEAGRHRLRIIEETAKKTGELLRFFHEYVSSTTDCPYSADKILTFAESYSSRLEHISHGRVKSQSLMHDFKQRIAGRDIRSIPSSGIHQDLTCDNVLYSESGKVCLIDINIKPGPIYSDLALLLIHPQTFRNQIYRAGMYFSEHLLDAYRSGILEGYFGHIPIGGFFVNIFCAIRVLDKWTMHAQLLHQYKGLKRIATRPLIPFVNAYFQSLLRRYLRAVTA